jgi:predicted nuclease of predicted toxin-antitoxin system
VKLFLDAHISARRVATRLREHVHDVRAADEERELDGCSDEQLLALAAGEERIFITFDVKDFSTIARRWAEAGRDHAGCAIFVGVDHSEFGTIIAAVTREIEAHPVTSDWVNRTLYIARAPSKLG